MPDSAGTGAPIRIRAATAADRAFMDSLTERLAGVADPPGRTPDEVMRFQRGFMTAAFDRPPAGAVTLVAEDERGNGLGFVHAEPQDDPFGEGQVGYVSLLAVTPAAEGRGVAARLMAAAEDWASTTGLRFLALDAFASNARGLAFYQGRGYRPETIRLVKPLTDLDDAAGP